jgi:hypothetical protein
VKRAEDRFPSQIARALGLTIDWPFGRVFTGVELGRRAIAVRVAGLGVGAGNEDGLHWIGPLHLDAANLALLAEWAEAMLTAWGGFVHLLPADGDASDGLRAEIAEDGAEDLADESTALLAEFTSFLALMVRLLPIARAGIADMSVSLAMHDVW